MEKLKTLKDLEACPPLMKEEFKTEACKWIVELEDLDKAFPKSMSSDETIRWIKHFFNIGSHNKATEKNNNGNL